MPSFAIVAEGITDQIIIDNLIQIVGERHFDDDVFVTFAQPIRDETDLHTAPHAGWELVFEYCELRIEEALSANDYVVIHIDTDQCDHQNFGVAITEGGVERPYDAIVNDVRDTLIEKIGPANYAEYAGRILFAIAVHSTECWLLLVLFNEHRTKNCGARLNHLLAQANAKPLAKTARSYTDCASALKWKNVRDHIQSACSLGLFLREVTALPKAAS
jgi:hypothetical protein